MVAKLPSTKGSSSVFGCFVSSADEVAVDLFKEFTVEESFEISKIQGDYKNPLLGTVMHEGSVEVFNALIEKMNSAQLLELAKIKNEGGKIFTHSPSAYGKPFIDAFVARLTPDHILEIDEIKHPKDNKGLIDKIIESENSQTLEVLLSRFSRNEVFEMVKNPASPIHAVLEKGTNDQVAVLLNRFAVEDSEEQEKRVTGKFVLLDKLAPEIQVTYQIARRIFNAPEVELSKPLRAAGVDLKVGIVMQPVKAI
jgi:hypothetical protein